MCDVRSDTRCPSSRDGDGGAAAGAGGCLCAQTRVDNAATNDPSSPWVCVSSFFFGSIRSIGNVDVLLYCRRSLVAHAQ